MIGTKREQTVAMLCAVVLAWPSVSASASPQDRTVSVLYAGSLAAVMENGIGPAFVKATGYGYQGEAQGSLGAAQMIRGRLRTPDIFISSDPAVNESLLMGPQNGSMVKWSFQAQSDVSNCLKNMDMWYSNSSSLESCANTSPKT